MKEEMDRLLARFDNQFAKGGLANIKFFIRKGENFSLADFVVELNKIQDTISAGETETVDQIDQDFEQRRFDEPFVERV